MGLSLSPSSAYGVEQTESSWPESLVHFVLCPRLDPWGGCLLPFTQIIIGSGEALILSPSENLTNITPFGTCSDFCPGDLLVRLVRGVELVTFSWKWVLEMASTLMKKPLRQVVWRLTRGEYKDSENKQEASNSGNQASVVGRENGRAAERREGSQSSGWVSLAFKLPSDFPAQPGLWEKLREFFQTAVVRHLQASLEFGLKSPTEGPHLFLNWVTSFKGFSRLRNVWFCTSMS